MSETTDPPKSQLDAVIIQIQSQSTQISSDVTTAWQNRNINHAQKKLAAWTTLTNFSGVSACLLMIWGLVFDLDAILKFQFWTSLPFRLVLIGMLLVLEFSALFHWGLSILGLKNEFVANFEKKTREGLTNGQVRGAVYIALAFGVIFFAGHLELNFLVPIVCGGLHVYVYRFLRIKEEEIDYFQLDDGELNQTKV